MKPGDLIQPRKWNISYSVPIEYIDIWDRPDGTETRREKLEHGEVGLLLAGRHCVGSDAIDLIMLEALIRGEKWWVVEDEVEVVK